MRRHIVGCATHGLREPEVVVSAYVPLEGWVGMKRLGALVAAVLVIAIISWAGPTSGQDQTEDRIAALETQVADHSREIERLEDQVGDLRRGDKRDPTATAEAAKPEGETATVSGAGVMVSDAFSLAPGRYRVTATVEATGDLTGFACYLLGPGNLEDLLFNELIQQPGTWTGSTVVTLDAGGEFFLQVENTDVAWQVQFEPL